MRLRWVTLGALSALAVNGFAFSLADDFESYALGTFPSPTWKDLGTIMPDGSIPDPSALIERKTTESNTQTHAVNFGDYYGYCSGIYAGTTVDRFYDLSVDVRVDRFGTEVPDTNPGDWPVAVGFNSFDSTSNPSGWNSIEVYASTLSKGWRLYGFDGTTLFDVDLGASVQAGYWYTVTMSFDNLTGSATTKITNLRTNTVVVNQVDTLSGWPTPTLDTVALLDGDDSYGDPLAVTGLANIDNVNAQVTPEPCSMVLLGVGCVAAVRRMRKR